jgi:hypothetical protein
MRGFGEMVPAMDAELLAAEASSCLTTRDDEQNKLFRTCLSR